MIRKGTLAFTNIMLGNKPVKTVYRGTVKLYPEDEPDTRTEVMIFCRCQVDSQAGVTLWIEASQSVNVQIDVVCMVKGRVSKLETFRITPGNTQSFSTHFGNDYTAGSMAIQSITPASSDTQIYLAVSDIEW